jgi:hypothetical protein
MQHLRAAFPQGAFVQIAGRKGTRMAGGEISTTPAPLTRIRHHTVIPRAALDRIGPTRFSAQNFDPGLMLRKVPDVRPSIERVESILKGPPRASENVGTKNHALSELDAISVENLKREALERQFREEE